MQAGAFPIFSESWHKDIIGTPIEKPDHCFHYIHLKSKSIRIWVGKPNKLVPVNSKQNSHGSQEKRHHAPLVQRLSRLTLVVTLRISRVTQASRCWWPSFVWPPRPQRRYGCCLLVGYVTWWQAKSFSILQGFQHLGFFLWFKSCWGVPLLRGAVACGSLGWRNS